MFQSVFKVSRVVVNSNKRLMINKQSTQLRSSSWISNKPKSFSTTQPATTTTQPSTKQHAMEPIRPNPDGLDAKTLSSLNGTPEAYLNDRVATISKNVRPSSQHGTSNQDTYKITFDKQQAYWSSALMGWTGTTDSFQSLEMDFASKEQAIRFCEENGYSYLIHKESETPVTQQVKAYADNFKYKGSGETDPLLKRDL